MLLKCFVFLIFFCLTLTNCGHVQPEFFCEKLHSTDQAIYKKLKYFATQNLTDYIGAYRLIQCENINEKFLHNDYLSEFEPVALLLEPVVRKIRNEKCSRQLINFIESLRNSSLWAVQMLDASTKIPQGLVNAETFQLGNYDECLEINLERKVDNIYGKYCLAHLQIIPTEGKYPRYYQSEARDPFSLKYDFYQPAWEKFLIPGITTRVRKDQYRSAVCVPNECTAADVQDGLDYLYNNMAEKYGFNIQVAVPENVCSVREEKEYSYAGNLLYRFLLGSFFWVVLVTIYDLITAKNLPGPPSSIVEIFSAYRNYNKLTDTERNTDFPALHSLKVMSLALIIFGHRVYLSIGGPIVNRQKIDETLHGTGNVYFFMLNGPIVVDTFLVISGFLVCNNLYSAFLKTPNLKFKMIYLSRWLRMTPIYMIMVFYYAYILENIGDGPLWKERVGREASRCRESWWTNLLYINNYINLDKICMLQSWYMAVDMHYLIIAPFIVQKLVFAPRKGLSFLLTLIGASMAATFSVIYYNQLPGVLKADIDLLEDQSNNEYYTQVYIKTHTRALPYLIGIATSFLYIKIQEKQYQIPRLLANGISILCIIFGLSAYASASIFQSPEKEYDPLESATFGALRRLFWALSMAWIVLGSSFDLLLIRVILKRKIFIPLSRLSYPVLLVHGIIQLYINGILRTAEYITFPRMLWMGAADLAATYFFALILHLVLEAPVNGLTKILLSPRKLKVVKNE